MIDTLFNLSLVFKDRISKCLNTLPAVLLSGSRILVKLHMSGIQEFFRGEDVQRLVFAQFGHFLISRFQQKFSEIGKIKFSTWCQVNEFIQTIITIRNIRIYIIRFERGFKEGINIGFICMCVHSALRARFKENNRMYVYQTTYTPKAWSKDKSYSFLGNSCKYLLKYR